MVDFWHEERLFIDGELVDAEGGATYENVNPATEEVARRRRRRVGGRHRPGHRRRPPGLRRDRLVDRRRPAGPLPAPAARRPASTTSRSSGPRPWPRSGAPVAADPRAPAGRPGRVPALLADLAETYEWTDDLGNAEPMGMPAAPLDREGSRSAWSGPSRRGTSRTSSTSPRSPRRSPPATPWCSSRPRPRPGRRSRSGSWSAENTDIPPGVLNIITSCRNDIGEAITTDPRVDLITFTGSTAVGKRIMAAALRHREEGVPRARRQVGHRRPRRLRHERGGRRRRLRRLHPRRPGLRHHHPAAAAPLPLRRGRRDRQDGARDDARTATRPTRPTSWARWSARSSGSGSLGYDRRRPWTTGPRWSPAAGVPSTSPRAGSSSRRCSSTSTRRTTIAQQEVFGPVLAVIAFDDDDDAVAHRQQLALRPVGSASTPATSSGPRPSAGASAPARMSINGGVYYGADVPFGGYKPVRPRPGDGRRRLRGVPRDQGLRRTRVTRVRPVGLGPHRLRRRGIGRRRSCWSTPGSPTAAPGGPSSTPGPTPPVLAFDQRGFGETIYEPELPVAVSTTPWPCSTMPASTGHRGRRGLLDGRAPRSTWPWPTPSGSPGWCSSARPAGALPGPRTGPTPTGSSA